MDEKYSSSTDPRQEDFRSHVSVARLLLRARLDQQMTQDELGRAAGTKQSRISEIEALKGNPRFDTLDRIARVLGLMITLAPRHDPKGEVQGRSDPWRVQTLVHEFNVATTSSSQPSWEDTHG